MYPTIFSINIPWINVTLEPRFYGLFYAISVLISSRILIKEVKRKSILLSEDEVMNFTFLIFLAGLIGGRVYEVILEWGNYYKYQTWWKVFAVWEGGMAIHGAIILSPLAIFIYCKIKYISLPKMLDISSICLILSQSIGRWGNFTNGEAAGPITNTWIGITFPEGTHVDRYSNGLPVHPTMIYESILNFILFLILWKIRLKCFKPGFITSIYLLGYSIIRSSLTPLRMDNQFIKFGDTIILAPYGISLILTIIALIWILNGKLWLYDKNPS